MLTWSTHALQTGLLIRPSDQPDYWHWFAYIDFIHYRQDTACSYTHESVTQATNTQSTLLHSWKLSFFTSGLQLEWHDDQPVPRHHPQKCLGVRQSTSELHFFLNSIYKPVFPKRQEGN